MYSHLVDIGLFEFCGLLYCKDLLYNIMEEEIQKFPCRTKNTYVVRGTGLTNFTWHNEVTSYEATWARQKPKVPTKAKTEKEKKKHRSAKSEKAILFAARCICFLNCHILNKPASVVVRWFSLR
jgi:hypothetical protein